eukprot:TRINITY_DN7823_c0_g1_i1.p2 TRINITY_DN7823_c0_g1~~TRINITY_DN7823_c0_g1_i1.p2  ORF type:complete len:414 (+),score=69.67 TRINITY_DN7823_c0_g1_i1:1537-2778(+)
MEFDDDSALARFAAKDKSGVDREVGKRWFEAVRSSDLVTLKDLLQICPSLLHYHGVGTTYGFIGSTALHWAAACDHERVLIWLLEKGAGIDTQNNGGSTALHSACSNNSPAAVKVLLQAGCNTTLVDCCGDVPQDVLPPDAQHMASLIRGYKIEAALRGTPSSSWSVADMKEALRLARVSTVGISEKSELVACVQELLASLPEPAVKASCVNTTVNEEDSDSEADEDAKEAAREAKEKGNLAYREGDAKGAVKWYTLALKLSREAVFYTNRSAAYMTLEKFELALADGKKAVELEPEWAKGHYRKGCALLQLQQPMEALWAFNTSYKLSETPSAELLNALNHAKRLVEADEETEDTEETEELVEAPRVQPKHAWFECVLCENSTRDYRETTCCKKPLCGTCLMRTGPTCPFNC